MSKTLTATKLTVTAAIDMLRAAVMVPNFDAWQANSDNLDEAMEVLESSGTELALLENAQFMAGQQTELAELGTPETCAEYVLRHATDAGMPWFDYGCFVDAHSIMSNSGDVSGVLFPRESAEDTAVQHALVAACVALASDVLPEDPDGLSIAEIFGLSGDC